MTTRFNADIKCKNISKQNLHQRQIELGYLIMCTRHYTRDGLSKRCFRIDLIKANGR